jgi:hypothetical protein
MYDELINKHARLFMYAIEPGNTVSEEMYQWMLKDFLEEAEKMHEKPRPAFNPRA